MGKSRHRIGSNLTDKKMDKVQLEECPRCSSGLFGAVKYCPFCGKNVEEISPRPLPPPKYGPITKGLNISAPGKSGAVVVTAVADSEDGLNIAGAEWWIGDDHGPGKCNPMEAVEGSFKSSRVDITASIDISKFKPGNHPINVRSADVRGEWGSPQTTTLTVEGQPATLYVNTSPSGAGLSVDGDQIRRTTPVSIEDITPGKHSLTISKAGYKDRNEQVNIAPGEKKSVEYALTPIAVKQPATLYVNTSPLGAQLTVDGTEVGRTPASIENIAAGRHSVTISRAGYENRNEQINIALDEKKTVEYPLTQIKRDRHLLRNAIVGILVAACIFISYKIISKPKERAQLSVSSSPSGAFLIIDGQNKGQTPTTGMSVNSGTHHIVVEKEGYLRKEQDISLGPREKKSLVLTLKKGRVDSAELNITTTPDQAVVVIDGNRKGTTPLTLKDITPGEHSLTISKVGYENRNEQINITGGEKKNLEYALTQISIPIKQTAMLYVNTSPSGAQLIVDGIQVGTTPVSMENIAPGEHSLTISKAGYENRNERINITSGEKKSMEYALSKISVPTEQTATLHVNTSPSGAQLTVDGSPAGKTPASIENVAPGEHSLIISKAGYENRNEKLNIGSGEKKSVEYALTPISIQVEETATLYVNTSPPGAYLSVDGVGSGTTPIHLPKLSIGKHIVSVVKPDYEIKEEIVTLSKGDMKVIRIILTATGGDVKKDIEDDIKEAIAAFNNSQYDVAIKMCQSILRKDPNNSTAHQYLQKAKEEQEKAINNALTKGTIKKIK